MSEQAVAHLKHEVLVGGGSNAVFNGLIAWLTLKGGEALSWSGGSSFVPDIIATAFILPVIVAFIVIPLQKRKLAKGGIDPINFGNDSKLQSMVNRLPASTWGNALWFGVLGIVIAAIPALIGFYIVGVEQVSPLNYSIFKGIWAGLMAAILVVPMVMSGLRAPGEEAVVAATTN